MPLASASFASNLLKLLRIRSVILRDDRHFSASLCAGTLLASRNDVIKTHVSRRCVNSVFGYAAAVLLRNRPAYSSAMSAFNDGFKPLLLANVNSRLRRIDGYGGCAPIDTLLWGRGKGKGKEWQQESDG